jgi:crotonobetainyl-CoA:carnitine CoA-transferase CaiB-like acyl-CoA transferase
VVITVGNNAQFHRFCKEVIDREDLANDARFKTNLTAVPTGTSWCLRF